jgi:hypothetical protein
MSFRQALTSREGEVRNPESQIPDLQSQILNLDFYATFRENPLFSLRPRESCLLAGETVELSWHERGCVHLFFAPRLPESSFFRVEQTSKLVDNC